MPDKERPTADDPLFPQSSPESDTIPAPSAANSDTTPTNVTPVKSGTPAYFSAARHKARLSSGVFLLSLLLTLLSGGVFLLSFFPLSPSYAALLSHLPPALAARPVIAANALFALLVMLVNFSLYRRGFSRFFRGAPDTDSLQYVGCFPLQCRSASPDRPRAGRTGTGYLFSAPRDRCDLCRGGDDASRPKPL